MSQPQPTPSSSINFETSDPAAGQIGHSPVIRFPEGWTLSTSWQRAQQEQDNGGPINEFERMVLLSESTEPSRVVWHISGRSLRSKCSCDGYHYRRFCSHVASLYWRFVTEGLPTRHTDTGRTYRHPPAWLSVEGPDQTLDRLTPAELDSYLHVVEGSRNISQFAEATGRSRGTVGNLKDRALDKLPNDYPHPHAGGGEL